MADIPGKCFWVEISEQQTRHVNNTCDERIGQILKPNRPIVSSFLKPENIGGIGTFEIMLVQTNTWLVRGEYNGDINRLLNAPVGLTHGVIIYTPFGECHGTGFLRLLELQCEKWPLVEFEGFGQLNGDERAIEWLSKSA